MEKISYQDALNHYVGAFILIPALVAGIYLMFMNYKSAVVLAERRVEDMTEVLSHDLTLAITQLRLELERSRTDEALSGVTDDIFLNGLASGRIQDLVDNYDYVEEAFIQKPGGYNIVGYPAASLGINSAIMERATDRIVLQNSLMMHAKLFLLDDTRRETGSESKLLSLADQFFFAVPLYTPTTSVLKPYDIRSVMWARIDLRKILEDTNRPDWAAGARYSFSLSDKLLFETHSVDTSENNRISSSSNLSVSIVHAGADLPIRFSLSESTKAFTADARRTFIKGTLAFIVIVVCLALLLTRFTAMLNRPLLKLIAYSDDISKGHYAEAPEELVFHEFENLRLAMTTMANTLQNSMRQLKHAASTDELTGLRNRRSFDESGELEFQRALRGADQEKTLWLIILDIDHFKRVNDTAGHVIGDKVIQAVAEVLAKIGRSSDIVGRLGGEEFGLLLPESTREGVKRVAASILKDVESMFVDGWTESGGPITVSIGCATVQGKQHFDELYRITDEALYASKWNGRNRVSFEEEMAANDSGRDAMFNDEASSA